MRETLECAGLFTGDGRAITSGPLHVPQLPIGRVSGCRLSAERKGEHESYRERELSVWPQRIPLSVGCARVFILTAKCSSAMVLLHEALLALHSRSTHRRVS
jgi:hypothetical protein